MRRLLLLIALTAAFWALATPAAASTWSVGEDPVDWTPHVLDGDVRAIVVIGDTAIVGGDFLTVTDSSGEKSYERWFIFSFSLRTGEVLDFAPWLDGPVSALAAGPNGTVFVGGSFTKAGDRGQRGITQVSLATGKPVDSFKSGIDAGEVRAIETHGDWVYIGGAFARVNDVERAGVARLSARDGHVDPGFDAKLSAPEIGWVRLEDIALSPSGDRLVVIGAITRAGEDYRVQAAMFDVEGTHPYLTEWWTNMYNTGCREGFISYVRGVAFSPDGQYFVIVTTGGNRTGSRLPCDTAARFETYVDGEAVPTWVNHTGGDSLYSVAIDDAAVYVGGHQRWMNNRFGREAPGPGAVPREGLAAIDPQTGMATRWNPSHSRGVGVRALVVSDHGLLVGSDTDDMGHEYHGRLGLLPY
jgi:hypothetical protein